MFGIGTELKSDYTDYAGINKEKESFWQTVKADGTLDALKAIAANDYVFAVNEAVNHKMMHYAGVMSEATIPGESRVIQFPKGGFPSFRSKAKSKEGLACLQSLIIRTCLRTG